MRRYLIVDDNIAFAENLAEILGERGGAEAVVVGGAREALALMGGRPFDALITDMRMPQLSGAELVHRVRALDPALPAIVITAHTHHDDLEAARREGLLAVLGKPVPIPRLLSLLEAARRGGLVALVEDDEALADNLTELLRWRGFQVVAARSLGELEALTGIAPFAAVVDLRIPGGPDGAALEYLRQRFPALPLVAMSGREEVPTPEPQPFLRKPFDPAVLLETLDRLYRARASA